ncbi:MAG: hypothetical protein QT00_C0002G0435 [archaeon GW2011_AR5]|nr:MAG: hypothetical protein QT00_C0002G0435 [archaeon GW2011_AR5]
MFEWKIIITVLVTLGLVLTYVGTNPTVSGFFDSVSGRFGSIMGESQRNVEFSLDVDKYGDFDFSAKEPVDFLVTGYTEATLKTGNLKTNKTVGIYGFRGTGSVEGNVLALDGKMAKVELPEITVSVQETVKSASTFTELTAKNLAVKEIRLTGVTGTLTSRGSTTQFSGDLTIASPMGDFDFGNGLRINGSATGISIPSAGISIR